MIHAPIVMTRPLTRALALLGTGLILHTSAVLAAEPSADPQQSARSILAPPVRYAQQAPGSVTQPPGRASWPDAQSLSRRFIVGVADARTSQERAVAGRDSQAPIGQCGEFHADAQTLARRIILGRSECSIGNGAQTAWRSTAAFPGNVSVGNVSVEVKAHTSAE